MKPLIFIGNNLNFNFSLLDSDEKMLNNLAKFMKERFAVSYDSFLLEFSPTNGVKNVLERFFGDRKLSPKYVAAIKEYNEWLEDNKMDFSQVTISKYTDLSYITSRLDMYKGPKNCFFDLLKILYEYRDTIYDHDKEVNGMKNVFRTNKDVKIFGYFYSCFTYLKTTLQTKMKPCLNKYPFDDFEKKVKECTCVNCNENKPLFAYLFHLNSLFDYKYKYNKNSINFYIFMKRFRNYNKLTLNIGNIRQKIEEIAIISRK